MPKLHSLSLGQSDITFINYLQNEFSISDSDLDLALKHRKSEHDPLEIILWQNGLLSTAQLAEVFDWFEP